MNNGKRAPSRGARPVGSGGAAVDALAPAGKKKVLKQPGAPDANGAASKAPQARAARAPKAPAEGEPEEKPKKLKKKTAPGAAAPEREDGESVLVQNLRVLQSRDGEAKGAAGVMQTAVKKAAAATRVPMARRIPSDEGGGAAGAKPDRTNPTANLPGGSGGDRVGPSILAGLKAGALTKPPSKKLPAPKTGPWRKIMMPTPQHIEWRAPMEYGFAVDGGGTWASFEDEEEEPAVEIPADQVGAQICTAPCAVHAQPRVRVEGVRVSCQAGMPAACRVKRCSGWGVAHGTSHDIAPNMRARTAHADAAGPDSRSGGRRSVQ